MKIIFDLDDTLYSNAELREKREMAIIEFLGEKAFSYLGLKKEGKGTIKSFKLLEFTREDFFKIINSVEIELERDELLVDMLNKLGENNGLIVLSNSPRISVETILDKLGILKIIDKYYAGEDFLNEKPDKSCFFMVEKNDVCVGNNFKKDLEIPKKLGAFTIFIGKESPADFNVESIYDVARVIGEISTA